MITQISEEIVRLISERLGERNDKGFETYKETLDDVPFDNYDWNMMINEELLDALQYAMKENFKLQQELRSRSGLMDTKVFEEDVQRTFNTVGTGYDGITNGVLGLTGEAGEVADILKKFLYQGHNLDTDNIIDELGDVLYYLVIITKFMGSTLDEVMTKNMIKRLKRYPNGFDKKRSVNRDEENDRLTEGY